MPKRTLQPFHPRLQHRGEGRRQGDRPRQRQGGAGAPFRRAVFLENRPGRRAGPRRTESFRRKIRARPEETARPAHGAARPPERHLPCQARHARRARGANCQAGGGTGAGRGARQSPPLWGRWRKPKRALSRQPRQSADKRTTLPPLPCRASPPQGGRSRSSPAARRCWPRPTCRPKWSASFPNCKARWGGNTPRCRASILRSPRQSRNTTSRKGRPTACRRPGVDCGGARRQAGYAGRLLGDRREAHWLKDPYALRRAALGVIRIVVENGSEDCH